MSKPAPKCVACRQPLPPPSDPMASREFLSLLRGAPVEPIRRFVAENLGLIALWMKSEAERRAAEAQNSRAIPTTRIAPP